MATLFPRAGFGSRGPLASVRAGAMGSVRTGAMASVRAGAMGSVRTGAMGSVRAGAMGSVRSRRFSCDGFILRRALARFCAAVVASFSDTFWHHFLTRLGSVSGAETTPSTALPIRARRASKCVHSCQVRPSTPAPSRSRFFRTLGSVRAGAMGSVRTGAMGSVRSRRFSFSRNMLRSATAQFCAAVVASFSVALWHHFLTRLGSVSGAETTPSTALPIRPRRVRPRVHSCPVRHSSPAPSR